MTHRSPGSGYTFPLMGFVPRRPFVAGILLTVVFVLGSAAYGLAQRGRGINVNFAPEQLPDGDFVICRLMYDESPRRFANGWRTDYPLGERNLSIRLSELTRTRVSQGRDGAPNHYVVRFDHDGLFMCPFLMAGDIGSIDLSEKDAVRLREYLLKGGFLWTDDMWGDDQWEVWQDELAKALPPSEYPIEELTLADPLFRTQFNITKMPQISNLGTWQRTGDTSERGEKIPHFHAIRDRNGRILVAMTRNTDIADAFEQEGADPEFFRLFGAPGYSLGINIILYALTH